MLCPRVRRHSRGAAARASPRPAKPARPLRGTIFEGTVSRRGSAAAARRAHGHAGDPGRGAGTARASTSRPARRRAGFSSVPVTLEDAYLVLMRLGALPGTSRRPRSEVRAMSLRRFGAIFGVEFAHSFRRPLFIVLALILALNAFGLSSGQHVDLLGRQRGGRDQGLDHVRVRADPDDDLHRSPLLRFFIAVAAGLTLLRDREEKVDVLLHSTPLTPGEYVWGRFLAVIARLRGGHAVAGGHERVLQPRRVPNPEAVEIRGPFRVR